MRTKRNAPALAKREGVECQLPGDIDAHSTAAVRAQFLARLGLPHSRAAIIAPLAFGEALS